MDLRPYGLNWQLDPTNKDSVVPADFLTRISLATNPGANDVLVTKTDGSQINYRKGKRLGGGTFGQVYECSTPTNANLVIKVINLKAGNLNVQSIIVETIIQIIIVNETRTSSYPLLNLVGPFAPEVYDVSYDAAKDECYIVTEQMRKTVRNLIDGWAPPPGTMADEQIGKNLTVLLVPINKILLELYQKLQYNHRDFKTDNCMYVRDQSGNFMPRIIDFGFSCINYKGLRISVGESQIQFRYCNLSGRDMTQFLYEIVHYRPWLPRGFYEVADALLTFHRGKKIYRLLAKTNVKSWSETYYMMNSSQENVNCAPIIFEKVLLAYKSGADWRNELAFNPLPSKKTRLGRRPRSGKVKRVKTPKVRAPIKPAGCPAEKPDYNPKTKRCVKACSPDKERNKDFKCVKKTVKAVVKGCPADKPDYNPKTKRCLKACSPDKERNKDFKCVKKAITVKVPVVKVCPPEKPDYNPKTKRCVKACTSTQTRDKTTFKCVKKPSV